MVETIEGDPADITETKQRRLPSSRGMKAMDAAIGGIAHVNAAMGVKNYRIGLPGVGQTRRCGRVPDITQEKAEQTEDQQKVISGGTDEENPRTNADSM